MELQELAQLLELMDEQLLVMTDLIALGRKKSQAIVSGDLQQLDLMLRGEQAVIWQMGRLEEQRFQRQLELSAQLGVHPSQLTLEHLQTTVPPELAGRCQALADQYGTVVQELTDLNHLNTELIQQAMAYVDFSLQLLGGISPTAGQVYSPKGLRNGKDKMRRLDNRV